MAANTSGTVHAFKREVMKGSHNLDANQIKLALYEPDNSIGPTTESYTAVGEIAATGDYSAGGVVLNNGTVTLAGSPIPNVGIWTPISAVTLTGVTLTTDCAYIYNATAGGKGIVSVFFGAASITGGVFGLNMPPNTSTEALVRIA